MNYEINGQKITYIIYNDGYDILFDNVIRYTQREPYIPDKTKSYEENAIAQIEDLIRIHEEEQHIIELEESKDDDINMLLIDYGYRLSLIELDL